MKKKFIVFFGAFAVIVLFIFSAFVLWSVKEIEFKRLDFPAVGKAETYSREFKFNNKTFQYEITPPYIYVTENDIRTTLEGIALWGGTKGKQKEAIQTIQPGLSGNYRMQFFLYMELSRSKKASFRIEHIRNEKKLQIFEIKKINAQYRYQLSLQLKRKDRLNFINEGNGIAAISHPVFYREKEKKQTNYVFLICVDTLRSDHIGAYNRVKSCTPNIDQLAEDSILFRQAYSTSSWTVPALVSFFTGLSTFKHGVDYGSEVLKESVPALFELLRKKFTCYSLTGGTFASSRFGIARGFDFFKEKKHDGLIRNASKLLFKEAVETIESEHHSNMILFLHTYQVHDPYLPEIRLAKEYYKDNTLPFKFQIVKFIKDRTELAKKVSYEKKRQIEQIYDAGIYTFDYRFGEFIDYLKQKNLYDSSTIILFSDHGEEFMDHGCWVHTHALYNELIKIPLIMKLPQNRKAGEVIDSTVSIMDILPTLTDLFDIKYDRSSIEGISLLKSQKRESRPRVLAAFLAPYIMHIPAKLAIIRGSDKLIYSEEMTQKDLSFFIYPPHFEKYEMYNVLDDPYEKNNLFKKDLEKSREMLRILQAFKIKRGKPGFPQELEEQLRALGYIK